MTKNIFFRSLYEDVPSLWLSDAEAAISNGLKSVVIKCFEPTALPYREKNQTMILYYGIISYFILYFGKWITKIMVEKNKKIRLEAAKKTIQQLEG